MKVRAVICDVDGTLLQTGLPPPDSAERWLSGCRLISGKTLTLATFDARCAEAVAAQHAVRRAAGEPFPEVDWLAVVCTALPGMDSGSDRALQISQLHAACSRSCTAMPGALAVLESLRRAGVHLGIASNAQHYTRDELTVAGFSISHFDSSISFFSGDHGFAKPSPRVFSHLTEILAARGIEPSETLMVGDSAGNDIEPARAAGWQTWWIGGGSGGTWEQLVEECLKMTKSETRNPKE